MNNITKHQIYIISLLIIMLVGLFFYGRNLDLIQHDKILHTAYAIIENDERLTKNILNTRLGLSRHYDEINENMLNMRSDYQELKLLVQNINSSSLIIIISKLDKIEREIYKKETIVESFKSANSILRNSLMYFTLSTSKLSSKLKGDNNFKKLFHSLGDISIQILQYYRNPNVNTKKLLDNKLLSIEKAGTITAYSSDIKTILAHGKLVSSKIQRVDYLLRNIVEIPVSYQMKGIIQFYLSYHKSSISRTNMSRLMITLVSALLVFYLLYLFVKLQKGAKQLSAANIKIAKEKELAEITLGSIADGVITTDADCNIIYMNPMAEYLTAWKMEDAANKKSMEVFNVLSMKDNKPLVNPVCACNDQELDAMSNSEYTLLDKNKNDYIIRLRVAPIRDDLNNIHGTVIVFHDISVTHKLVQHINHLARHDELTGLVNRREFEERLQQAIKETEESEIEHAMCFLDLDQFKIVNDTCGHIAGDELLRQLAVILGNTIRASDTLSRLGGDEFGLLLHGCKLERAEVIAEQFRDTIENFRFTWKDKIFDIGVSIGLVAIKPGVDDIVSILSKADIACYTAKDRGRNRVHVYSETDKEIQKRHKEMYTAASLKQALEGERFLLYCQLISPIKEQSVHDSSVEHYEILIRMYGEEDEILPPGAFIPAAERYGLMSTIDKWVIEESFKLLDILNNQSKDLASSPTYEFSINLSGNTICYDGLKEFIESKQQQYKINPDWVCFEVTETSAVANLNDATQLIKELKNIGFKFSLDDFGSGMSSFTYLKALDVNFLKIDGSFVRDIEHDEVDYAMVESINHIGQVMGMSTIAEFVENNGILKKLQELGVDYGQGYGIDPPRPVSDLLKLKK